MKNLRDFNFIDLLDSGSCQIEPDIQFNVMDKDGTFLGKSDNTQILKLFFLRQKITDASVIYTKSKF